MIRVFGPNAGWDIPADHWNSRSRPGLAVHGLGRPRLRHRPLADRPRGHARLRPVRELHGHPARPTRARWRTTRSTTGRMVQIWLTYELPEPTLGSAMQLLITGSKGIIELDAYGTVRLGTPDGGWETDLRADAVRSARRRRSDPAAGLCLAAARPDAGHRPRARDPFVSGRQGALTTSMLEAAERSAAIGPVRPPATRGLRCVLTGSASCSPRDSRRSARTSTRSWPTVVEMVGHTRQFDYVEFSGEYAPYDLHGLDNFCRAAELLGPRRDDQARPGAADVARPAGDRRGLPVRPVRRHPQRGRRPRMRPGRSPGHSPRSAARTAPRTGGLRTGRRPPSADYIRALKEIVVVLMIEKQSGGRATSTRSWPCPGST